MPTNQKRIRRVPVPPIREDFAIYLLNGIESNTDFDFYHFKNDRDRQKQMWEENKKGLMPQWQKDNPCKRPFSWWRFEAPGPRLMVGGKGVRADEKCNYKQHFVFGTPKYWLEFDEKNPPMFEAQATYLQRNDLLSAREVKIISGNADLLKPETIFDILKPRILFDASKFNTG